MAMTDSFSRRMLDMMMMISISKWQKENTVAVSSHTEQWIESKHSNNISYM